MKRTFILITLLVGLLTSCKTTYTGGYSVIPDLKIGYNVNAKLVVDTTKVLQATSTTTVYFRLIRTGDNNFSDAFGGNVGDREKSAATYKALLGTGQDIIVNPKYHVVVSRGLFIRRIEATVGGYGAKIYLK